MRLLFLAGLLAAQLAAPLTALDILATAGPKPRLDAEHRAAEQAWLRTHLIDAYTARGRTNPQWDADVLRLGAWVVAYLTHDLEPMPRTGVVAVAKRLTAKGVGCDDPLVAYAAFLASEYEWTPMNRDFTKVNPWVNLGIKLFERNGVKEGKPVYPTFVLTDLLRWQAMTWDQHPIYEGKKAQPVREMMTTLGAAAAIDLADESLAPVADLVIDRLLARNHLHCIDGAGLVADAFVAGAAAIPAAWRTRAVLTARSQVATSCARTTQHTPPPADRAAEAARRAEEARAALAEVPADPERPPVGLFQVADDGHGWDAPEGRLVSCLRWRLDHLPAYHRTINLLAGAAPYDAEPISDFIRSCAAVPRVDTPVPWQAVEAAAALCRIDRVYPKHVPLAATLTPLLPELERVLDAYAQADPPRADRCTCLKAALQAKAGKTAEGAATLATLPKERWVRAVEWSCTVALDTVAVPNAKPDKPAKPR